MRVYYEGFEFFSKIFGYDYGIEKRLFQFNEGSLGNFELAMSDDEQSCGKGGDRNGGESRPSLWRKSTNELERERQAGYDSPTAIGTLICIVAVVAAICVWGYRP